MLNIIDKFLDGITMYRLVHYELIILLIIAGIFGLFGIIPYSPWSILISSLFLVAVCLITNKIFAYVYKVPSASESYVITALILALIISPVKNIHDLPLLFWAGVWSQAAKYLFAINKSHIFNPVAIAVVLTSFWLGQGATWWVATAVMAPFVTISGLLIVKKIQREDMVFAFFTTAIIASGIFALFKGTNLLTNLKAIIVDSSLLFFGFVMFTEPLTAPTTRTLQILYGIFIGFLFSPNIHIGSLYSTPELALVTGNALSFIISPKERLMLALKEKTQIGSDIIDFIFTPSKPLAFVPGQYMEWTLPHKKEDSRGNRRYFTIASSPTEKTIQLGVKFYPKGSTFKRALSNFSEKDTIVAGQLAGDFVLPENLEKKLVFLAGGIGITPFRSMIKYVVDSGQSRNIILLYSNKLASEIMYKDVFDCANEKLNIKTIYSLTDKESIPSNWQGRVGRFDKNAIQEEVSDFMERIFYLSGPQNMVQAFEKTLKEMGIPNSQIKKDFFPGFV